MLLDSTHRRWLIVTAVLTVGALALHRVLDARSPERLTGGSFVGLWYGIVGSLLMVYAGLLSAHRRLPVKRWLGARQSWLRGHLWLGFLSGILILCHSGYSWGRGVTLALWIVLLGVFLTGLFGLAVQQLLPRLMTSRVPCEAPYEQIPHLCRVMRREADAIVDNACGPFDPRPQNIENTMAAMQYAGNARIQLREFYEQDIRPFLDASVPRRSPLLNPVQLEARFGKLKRLPGMEEMADDLQKLHHFCEERRLLLEQERMHFWLHSWLLVHIPLSVALLVLGVLHVVTALYY